MKKLSYKIMSLFLLALLFVACGSEREQTVASVSLGFTSALSEADGGMVLFGHSPDLGLDFVRTSPTGYTNFEIPLDSGQWEFFMIIWNGAGSFSKFSGISKCAYTESFLEGSFANIDLSLVDCSAYQQFSTLKDVKELYPDAAHYNAAEVFQPIKIYLEDNLSAYSSGKYRVAMRSKGSLGGTTLISKCQDFGMYGNINIPLGNGTGQDDMNSFFEYDLLIYSDPASCLNNVSPIHKFHFENGFFKLKDKNVSNAETCVDIPSAAIRISDSAISCGS